MGECVVCGGGFVDNVLGKRKVYCGLECRDRAYRVLRCRELFRLSKSDLVVRKHLLKLRKKEV